jgi:hypothetical protein
MAKKKPRTTRRKPIPSPDTIIASSTIVSPKGRVYRVLRTNQVDPYDPPIRPKKADERRRKLPKK